MHPGAIIRAIPGNAVLMAYWDKPVWVTVTVVACARSRYSSTPWVDEKTGKRNFWWPKDVSWKCTVLFDNRLDEWTLDDDDRGKSWDVVV